MALITPTKTNNQGFTPKEQADLDAADQELDAGEPAEEAEEPEAPAEEADAEPEVAEEAAPQDAPKDAPKGKPPAGYVPIAALKERDHKLQEMREKVARMEGAWTQIQQRFQPPQQPNAQQQQQAQIPAYEQDPLGHLQGTIQALNSELAAIKGHTQQQTQMTQQQAQYQQVMNRYASDLSTQARKTPDFTDAYNWLAANVEAELEARGFDNPEQRAAIIRQEEETVIANAYQSGKNPAEILYNLAKHRGYKGKQPEENRLERLQKGQKAAASLSQTKGAGNAGTAANMSLESLSELYKSDPDAADKMWVQMAKSGRL